MGVDVDMGIRFYCPKGHKLNVKEFQAGRMGICPSCGARIQIPTESTRLSSRDLSSRETSSKKTKQGDEPQEEMAPSAPSRLAGEGVPDLAPPPGPRTPAKSPGTEPAAAEHAAAVEPVAAVPANQGSAFGAAVGSPAMRSAPQPSPVVGPQNPLPAPAGVSPVPFPVPAPLASTAPAPPGSAPAGPSAAGDPLAEAGEMVWYVRPASGGQFGPAGSEVMRCWLQQGRVGADSQVWREGWPDWRQAAGVFPQFGTGRPNALLEEVAAAETAATGASAARSRRAKSRRQSKKNQALAMILLIFVVMALFGVLLWVLQ